MNDPKNLKTQNSVEILAVGGYGKLIANMTAIIFSKRIIIIDSGKSFVIPPKLKTITPKILSNLRPKVANFKVLSRYLESGYILDSLIITHNHGDHLGGIKELFEFLKSYGISKGDYRIYTTPYCYEFSSRAVPGWPKDSTIVVKNYSKVHLSTQNYFYAFYLNHSSLYTMGMYLIINSKKILFLPDHRKDYTTSLGPNEQKVNQTLRKINESSPDVLILEGTTIGSSKPDPTESSACQNLINTICYEASLPIRNTILISTYGTNPERLRSILLGAKKCGRRVVVFGHGMETGLSAAIANDLIEKNLACVITKDSIEKVNREKKKYILLLTGHMGEYSAALGKMIRGEIRYNWSPEDCVILSSKTIPKEGPRLCRAYLEASLLTKRVKLYSANDVQYPPIHSSGHISDRDYVYYFQLFTKVKLVIINHSDLENSLGIFKLLEENKEVSAIKPNKVRILLDGERYLLR